MDSLIVAPLLFSFFSGVLCLFAWGRPCLQKTITVFGQGFFLLAAVLLFLKTQQGEIFVFQAGSWPAPFGISFVIDAAASLMLLGTGLVSFSGALFSLRNVPEVNSNFGFFPLYNFLILGVAGAFSTGDLFNLYVWFEVLLMSSFALMITGGKPAQFRGGYGYVLINILSSALFLSALGLLYGNVGSLNIADIAVKVNNSGFREEFLPVAALLFLAFAVKSAVFPLFFWLPISYHTPLPVVSGVFAGLLTKVGVYSLFRLFTLVYPIGGTFFQPLLVVLSVLTMVIGVFGAAAQYEIRRILSVHIVSQVGYIVLALSFDTRLGVAAALFFIFHQMIVKTNLFYISGVIERLFGTGYLKRIGGLFRTRPFLSLIFLLSAMSLAGIPPLSGFVGKFLIVTAGFVEGFYYSVAASLFVSVLTLFSMTKIWAEAFWKELPDRAPHSSTLKIPLTDWAPITGLAFLALCLGLLANPIVDHCLMAADQVMGAQSYITAVLGVR